MKNCLLGMLFLLVSSYVHAQTYSPVAVTGFNHDVIADGTGTSSAAVTTKEMDAITPSNFVICSKQFATTNNLLPANTYGLADNGTIVTGTRTYQLAPYNGSNALYLLTSETGTLTLATPGAYSRISLLTLSTENAATVNIIFTFSDGTTYVPANSSFTDWVNNFTNVAIQGFGRVKRKAGPFFQTIDYEMAPTNPRMYYKDFTMPCNKTLVSVTLKNVTSTIVTPSNRAFVFAVSGVATTIAAPPAANDVNLCTSGPATIAVESPSADLIYRWYSVATGGTALGTGSSFTSGTVTGDTAFYVEAVNNNNCVSGRTAVPVTILPPLTPPVVDGISICASETPVLEVQNAAAGITYHWYNMANGGTELYGGDSFTPGALTGDTTFYVEAMNSGNCISSRTPAAITLLPLLAQPVVSATSIEVDKVTFTWTPVNGATGYLVSVNGGPEQPPSSGATGTTHVVTGLAPLSAVSISVKATGDKPCQTSPVASATAKTLTDQIYIPNVFTPNGDGRNDEFKVYGNTITAMSMKIFNQWGELVFEGRDAAKGWDGSYKGKQQPVGVYIYVIRLTLLSGEDTLKKGDINLVR